MFDSQTTFNLSAVKGVGAGKEVTTLLLLKQNKSNLRMMIWQQSNEQSCCRPSFLDREFLKAIFFPTVKSRVSSCRL
jgi:hypothetical protein